MRAFVNSNNIVYATFLCAVLCFAWSTQDKLHIHITAPVVQELRQHAETCSKDTGVAAANLRKIIDKTLPDDRVNKEFFECIVSKSGFVDKDGHFIPDKMLSLDIVDGTKEGVVNTIKECNKISLADNVETAYATADCVHNAYHFSV